MNRQEPKGTVNKIIHLFGSTIPNNIASGSQAKSEDARRVNLLHTKMS